MPIFLFILFPLVSCTSNGTSGIYLLEWKQTDLNNKTNWFRVGYYGLCWVGGDFSGKDQTCARTSGKSATSISKQVYGLSSPTNDIKLALDLEKDVFVAFMTAAGVIWLVSLIGAILLIVRKGKAGVPVRLTAKLTAAISAILMVAASWATSSGVAALEALNRYSTFSSDFKGGDLLVGLQWAAAVLACVYAYLVFRLANKDTAKEDTYNYNIGR